MARIIGLIVVALAAATVLILLTTIEGYTRVEFNGLVMDPPTGALLALLFGIALLLIFGTSLFGYFARLPSRLRDRRDAKQRDRGMVALTRGLEAVAAGDAEDAQHHARLANKTLDSPALTRLLTAQAAQLAGDDDTARSSYAAMLEAPETEFLGLRGLYLQAMHRGDKDQAKTYADRAFRLRPGAPWAFESVYTLSVDRGRWGDAYEALRLAHKQGVQDADEASRKAAALLTARAYAAMDAGDEAAAREDAEDALKRDAGLTPAAVLAARLEAAHGKRGRALKILDAAWARSPHPALSSVMRELFADAPPARRNGRLRKLADKNSGHAESQLLLAELLIEEGKAAEARDMLEPLLLDRPTARTFAAMAEAMGALNGPAAAEPWRARAAEAPRDPAIGAKGDFELTTEGWQRLVHEYGEHGRLVPPPLEVVETGLAREELVALTSGTAAEPDPEPTHDDRPNVVVSDPVAEEVMPLDTDEAIPPAEDKADLVHEQPAGIVVEEEPKRRRRFISPFRTSEAEADARTEAAIGPEMRDETLVRDDDETR